MIKLSDEDVRRFIEVARNSGLEVSEEARRSVAEGEPPEFYLGFLGGIVSVVHICRSLTHALGVEMDRNSRNISEGFAAGSLIVEAIELVTMRAVRPAAVAAELWLKSQEQSD